MKTGQKKLDQVIGDINEMAVKGSGEAEMTSIQFDELVSSLVARAKNLAGAATVKFEYEASPANVLVSDVTYLTTILWALLDNSIKYRDAAKSEQRVVISMVAQKGNVVIRVWDNGRGIDEHCLPQIFNMFYRGETDTDGTGLGLYMAASVVKKLDGKITVSSRVGEYAEFTVILPA